MRYHKKRRRRKRDKIKPTALSETGRGLPRGRARLTSNRGGGRGRRGGLVATEKKPRNGGYCCRETPL